MAMKFVRANLERLASAGTFSIPAVVSVSYWVFLTSLAARHRPFGTNTDWEGRIETSGLIVSDLYTSGQSPSALTSVTALALNTWYHIVQSNAAGNSTHSIYINGVLDATNSPTGGSGTNAVLQVGAREATDHLDGSMDDFRIYNRILPAEEVETIYALRGRDGIKDGLVIWLPMNEGAPGSTPAVGAVVERTGNGAGNFSPNASPVYAESRLTFRRKVA